MFCDNCCGWNHRCHQTIPGHAEAFSQGCHILHGLGLLDLPHPMAGKAVHLGGVRSAISMAWFLFHSVKVAHVENKISSRGNYCLRAIDGLHER